MIDRNTEHDADDGARRLIEAGAGIAGGIGGTAALGLIFGAGAGGALPVAVAGGTAALVAILREVGERVLGHREEIRVGGVAVYAAMAYRERADAGNQLRDDNWFEERPSGRSIAAEICEGTLLIAQREHEERKVKYYGYLLANLSFEQDIDEYLANWLLQVAEQLTWSQLVLLAMIERKDQFTLPSITIGQAANDWTPWGLHQQLANLGFAQRELIGARRDPETPSGLQYTIPQFNSFLPEQELKSGGKLLYYLMGLEKLPAHDIEIFIELLQPSEEAGRPVDT